MRNDFVNFIIWIKRSVKIDFSTEHNLTSIYRYYFICFSFIFLEHLEVSCFNKTDQNR